jgi:hypothetical protein
MKKLCNAHLQDAVKIKQLLPGYSLRAEVVSTENCERCIQLRDLAKAARDLAFLSVRIPMPNNAGIVKLCEK